MHIEVVRGGRDQRGHVLPKSKVFYLPGEEELYYSLFGMDQSIYEHLALTQSTANFPGSYYADFLYLVVRREADPAGALRAAQRIVKRLHERFAVSPQGLLLYFSGGCSFHIGLSQRLFGGFQPGHMLPAQLDALSTRVVATCFDISTDTLADLEQGLQAAEMPQHFADVVPSICQPTQLLRAPNSWHPDSGRYKIPLHAHELLTISASKLLHLAAAPRPAFVPMRVLSEQPSNDGLRALWQQVLGLEPAAPEVVASPGPTAGPLFAPPLAGENYPTLDRQAHYLFTNSTLSEAHVLRLIEALNQASRTPLPPTAVQGLVQAAAQQSGRLKPVTEHDACAPLDTTAHLLLD